MYLLMYIYIIYYYNNLRTSTDKIRANTLMRIYEEEPSGSTSFNYNNYILLNMVKLDGCKLGQL